MVDTILEDDRAWCSMLEEMIATVLPSCTKTIESLSPIKIHGYAYSFTPMWSSKLTAQDLKQDLDVWKRCITKLAAGSDVVDQKGVAAALSVFTHQIEAMHDRLADGKLMELDRAKFDSDRVALEKTLEPCHPSHGWKLAKAFVDLLERNYVCSYQMYIPIMREKVHGSRYQVETLIVRGGHDNQIEFHRVPSLAKLDLSSVSFPITEISLIDAFVADGDAADLWTCIAHNRLHNLVRVKCNAPLESCHLLPPLAKYMCDQHIAHRSCNVCTFSIEFLPTGLYSTEKSLKTYLSVHDTVNTVKI